MTSTSKESVLVTLECPHFAVFPTPAYQAFTRAYDQEQFVEWQSLLSKHSDPRSSLKGLWEDSPTLSVHAELRCGRLECLIHSNRWALELRTIHAGLMDYWDTRKALYLELGKEYFNMLPFLPASAMNGSTGLAAHQQFSIETRHWTEDPFFISWQNVALAMNSAPSADKPEALGYFRAALKYLVRGVADMLRLMEDMWKLKELFEEHSKRSRIDSLTDRRLIFGNAARAAFERRMRGFENFGVNVKSVKRSPPELWQWQDEDEEMPTIDPHNSMIVYDRDGDIDMDWQPELGDNGIEGQSEVHSPGKRPVRFQL